MMNGRIVIAILRYSSKKQLEFFDGGVTVNHPSNVISVSVPANRVASKWNLIWFSCKDKFKRKKIKKFRTDFKLNN